ncbi:MAG: sulfite exporter TauE/SafE family protein [Micromonosporaceae bacterium]
MTPDLAMVLAGITVLLGSVIQGSVGFGMALVAAPCMMLLDPSLMPGSLLMVACALALFGVVRDWRHVDWSGFGWALAGRVPGSVGGAWLVVAASPRLLGAVVGGIVLAAVVLTARTVEIPIRRESLLTAGAFSGVTATSTAIGGPVVALLYQHAPGPRVRGTLGMFFLAGTLFSLSALGVAGELDARELMAGGLMLPFMAVGLAASVPLRRYLDNGRLRWAVLAIAAGSAVVLLVRSVF